MLLPRTNRIPLPFLLGLVTVVFICGEIATAQKFDSPPRYNYDSLPRTAFTCQGKLPGRYYPDPETDCQMFHVCVKMNSRDIQDFKFLCPNGTVFDSEHQVCVDYYQVVCHENVGTNPLGHIFEIYKISSGQKNPDLDVGKLSFVNPDSIEKNTLGDDFQVQEYNNNRLAQSQNALNFRASSAAPSRKSNKEKEDIFFSNKGGFVPSTFGSQPATTKRSTTTSTTTEAPSSSTPRRPSLETFESYETESFSGFIPSRNSFGRGQDPTPDFDASTEDIDPYNAQVQTSTTSRPLVYQNTFRTTLSHISSTTRPSAQTFQQQPTRFNDQYFTRIPTTTSKPVSKAAQFFKHTSSPDDYFTPEYRQPTVNPFVHQAKSVTTVRPSVLFQSNTVRPKSNNDFQYYESTTYAPTSTTDFPTTTQYFGRQSTDFETRQTTTYSSFGQSVRNSNFFSATDKTVKQEFSGKSHNAPQRPFSPQLSSEYVEEESLKPRNIHGNSNGQNSFSKLAAPPAVGASRPRDFGFSTVPPPTTAEPFSTPVPTTTNAPVTQTETAQTLASRLQGQLFKKVTSKNPEKFSIFFGRSTQSVSDDRLPSPGPTTVLYYDTSSTTRPLRTRSTTAAPDFEQVSSASESIIDRRLVRLNAISSTTTAPDQVTSSSNRPLRRGARRRVRPGARRQQGKNFDPQLKYTRRRGEARFRDTQPRENAQKNNDEIFNAEASVFRGDPTINNFFQDQRKEAHKAGSQKNNEKSGQSQPSNDQFYGRRVRPNGSGRGDAQIQQNNNNYNGSSSNNTNHSEGPQVQGGGNRPEVRRRVVKRIRPKSTTVVPGNDNDESAKKQFLVTGSTLRPVTRINVKTKLGGKVATTYRTTEITDGSSFTTSRPTTTTTAEPELITASEDEIARRRSQQTSATSTTPKSTANLNNQGSPKFSNNTHLVITVLTDKHFPGLSSSPVSNKKPVVGNSGKKLTKPGPSKKIIAANGNEEESHTRSPDYDYAYYNTDDASDYAVETSNIDHKNYGSKPNKVAK